MSHGITLSKSQCATTPDEQNKMSVIPYASAIGCIMYAMLCTRPDVSFALSVTSRYQSDFGEDHWTVVKCILKYLRRTKDMFEGKRGGYASAKQKFPRKTGTAAVRDHGITTRRADAAEPSRCRRTRRG
jgi:hypothetical protein